MAEPFGYRAPSVFTGRSAIRYFVCDVEPALCSWSSAELRSRVDRTNRSLDRETTGGGPWLMAIRRQFRVRTRPPET